MSLNRFKHTRYLAIFVLLSFIMSFSVAFVVPTATADDTTGPNNIQVGDTITDDITFNVDNSAVDPNNLVDKMQQVQESTPQPVKVEWTWEMQSRAELGSPILTVTWTEGDPTSTPGTLISSDGYIETYSFSVTHEGTPVDATIDYQIVVSQQLLEEITTDANTSTSGTPGTGNTGDGTTETGNTGDGTTETGNTGDGTTGTPGTGDGTTGTDNTGDGTTGTGNTGDGTTGTGNTGDGTTGTPGTGMGIENTARGGYNAENPNNDTKKFNIVFELVLVKAEVVTTYFETFDGLSFQGLPIPSENFPQRSNAASDAGLTSLESGKVYWVFQLTNAPSKNSSNQAYVRAALDCYFDGASAPSQVATNISNNGCTFVVKTNGEATLDAIKLSLLTATQTAPGAGTAPGGVAQPMQLKLDKIVAASSYANTLTIVKKFNASNSDAPITDDLLPENVEFEVQKWVPSGWSGDWNHYDTISIPKSYFVYNSNSKSFEAQVMMNVPDNYYRVIESAFTQDGFIAYNKIDNGDYWPSNTSDDFRFGPKVSGICGNPEERSHTVTFKNTFSTGDQANIVKTWNTGTPKCDVNFIIVPWDLDLCNGYHLHTSEYQIVTLRAGDDSIGFTVKGQGYYWVGEEVNNNKYQLTNAYNTKSFTVNGESKTYAGYTKGIGSSNNDGAALPSGIKALGGCASDTWSFNNKGFGHEFTLIKTYSDQALMTETAYKGLKSNFTLIVKDRTTGLVVENQPVETSFNEANNRHQAVINLTDPERYSYWLLETVQDGYNSDYYTEKCIDQYIGSINEATVNNSKITTSIKIKKTLAGVTTADYKTCFNVYVNNKLFNSSPIEIAGNGEKTISGIPLNATVDIEELSCKNASGVDEKSLFTVTKGKTGFTASKNIDDNTSNWINTRNKTKIKIHKDYTNLIDKDSYYTSKFYVEAPLSNIHAYWTITGIGDSDEMEVYVGEQVTITEVSCTDHGSSALGTTITGNASPVTFTANSDKSNNVFSWTNAKANGTFVVEKWQKDNNQAAVLKDGIKFILTSSYPNSTNLYQRYEAVTGANGSPTGKAIFKDIPCGKYILTEDKPDGYTSSLAAGSEYTIKPGTTPSASYDEKVFNTQIPDGSVVLFKKYSDTSALELAGKVENREATFEVYSNSSMSGPALATVTTVNRQLMFTSKPGNADTGVIYLPADKYYLKEIGLAAQYSLRETQPIEINVPEGGKSGDVTVHNDRLNYKLDIEKLYNGMNSSPKLEATFKISSIDTVLGTSGRIDQLVTINGSAKSPSIEVFAGETITIEEISCLENNVERLTNKDASKNYFTSVVDGKTTRTIEITFGTDSQDKTVKWNNARLMGSFEVLKVYSDGAAIPVWFVLDNGTRSYERQAEVVEGKMTPAYFYEIPAGTYTLTERADSIPPNYTSSIAGGVTIEILANGSNSTTDRIQTYTVTNSKNGGGENPPDIYTPPTNTYTPPVTATPVEPAPPATTPVEEKPQVTVAPAQPQAETAVVAPAVAEALPELPKTGAESMANIMLLASMFAGSGLVLRRAGRK